MWETLLFVYMVNGLLLIVHEMDSVYWKEWDLFGLRGGIDCFLLVHFPLVLIMLYGLSLVARQAYGGLFYSLLLSASGIIAFGAHKHFTGQGREGFTSLLSQFILTGTLVMSFAQAILTLLLLFGA